MQTISKYLQDPGWWFSAFFVAIIASVIAGFLKERIERWFGKAFSGLKVWRAENEARRKEIIEVLLKDQMYFIIAIARSVIALVLFTMATLLFLVSPLLLMSVPASSGSSVHIDRAFIIWNVLGPFLGFCNIFIGYSAARHLSIIGGAIRVYRKRNDLPKLF